MFQGVKNFCLAKIIPSLTEHLDSLCFIAGAINGAALPTAIQPMSSELKLLKLINFRENVNNKNDPS